MSLDEFQESINIKFGNQQLLKEALTHKSYSVENNLPYNNERLELLGDSIISVVVIEYLFENYKSLYEAEISKLKAYLVSRKILSKWAKKINLNNYIFLSFGEKSTGGAEKESILASCFEALAAAIYIDKGYQQLKQFITENFLIHEELPEEFDYKTTLQEVSQKVYKTLPVYTVIKEEGPQHDKTFLIEVEIRNEVLGSGEGKTKKEAEQAAAKAALERLKLKNSSL